MKFNTLVEKNHILCQIAYIIQTECYTHVSCRMVRLICGTYKQTGLIWSERNPCDQRSNLGRPLFFRYFSSTSSSLIPLFKTPECVVVGF